MFIHQILFSSLEIKSNNDWMLNVGLSRYAFYNSAESIEAGINSKLISMIKSTDVLIVHWVAGFVNSYDIRELKEKTDCRVIFYTLDMAHITGGCHFSWNCEGYKRDCLNCPALDNNKELASAQIRSKSINISSMNATCICDPLTGLHKAMESSIPFADYYNISVVIDTDIYKPAHNNIKHNSEKKIFCNADIGNIRKGYSYLYQTMIILDNLLDDSKNIILQCLYDKPFKHYNFKHIKIENFEYINDETKLASMYQKSDVFVCTSIEDYGPSMLYEALLCGLPTIAFNVGAASEVIKNSENGYLVEKFDVIDMAKRVYESLYVPESIKLIATEIHARIEPRFNKNIWASRLEEVLQNS